MSVRIIIDSTSDLCPEVKERLMVVPLTVQFGEEEFIDGVTITHKQFYEKLIESDVLPRTSQANPAAFSGVFEEVAKSGDTAVVITVASKLSGTYQSAMIAAEDYPESIYVVDSRTVAIGAGILAELALQLADRGMTAEEIAKKITEERDNVCLIAMLDTLEYLKKGGRISKTVAFAGGVDFEKPIMLGYTGLSDILLQKYVEDSKALWAEGIQELRSTPIGSVVGTHAGPGAVAAAFFKK